jgi:hypothetical protein
VARTSSVERTAAAYAQIFDGVIRASSLVLIVEPVFDPQDTRFTTTLQAIASLEPIAGGQITPCLIGRSDNGALLRRSFDAGVSDTSRADCRQVHRLR